MENKRYINIKLILGLSFILAFIIWTFIVKFVDVKLFNNNDIYIGLASINIPLFNYFGVNHTAATISDIMLYPILATTLIFGTIGLIQLIKRKSLFKVDKELYVLLIGYALATILYILFNIFAVNYRPIMLDNKLESSYPSSHTMASIFFLLAGSYTGCYYLKDKNKIYRYIITISTYLILIVLVVLRFLSGLHWFSDIIGGLILSIGLYYLFLYFMSLVHQRQSQE